jgi:competence protein ComEC
MALMDVLTGLINSFYHEPHASLVNGIILGRDLYVTEQFKEQLKQVGLIHIVVLSGQNITLLSNSVLSILTPVIGRGASLIFSIIIIIVFVFFVGAEAPAVRAGIMGVLALLGQFMGRRTFPLYTLFLSCCLMLLFDFKLLTSISFQLSFGATLGILLFGGTAPRAVPPKKTKKRFSFEGLSSFINEELRTSLSAQVFTLPIIFWYFRQISFISPLSNLLTSFLIAPIMLIGTLAMLFGMINWHLGYFISLFANPCLAYMTYVIKITSQIPGGFWKF